MALKRMTGVFITLTPTWMFFARSAYFSVLYVSSNDIEDGLKKRSFVQYYHRTQKVHVVLFFAMKMALDTDVVLNKRRIHGSIETPQIHNMLKSTSSKME